MNDKTKKVIDEEVDAYVENLSTGELLEILQESSPIINSLGKAYDQYYNVDNEITPENWQFFMKALEQLVPNEEFQKRCKEVNCKLYCVKYFTKLKFAIAENAEATLKFELKKYFPQLVTSDGNEFMNTFFTLPFEFTSLVVRYLANVAAKKKKNDLTPQLQDAQEFYNDMQKRKNNFINEINKISQGQSNVFSLAEAQELLDVKAFFEYNPINTGVLEYIVRILTNESSKQKLEDEFGKFKIQLMMEQVLQHPSYVQFLQEIRDNETEPFFTDEGTQNKYLETSFDGYVMQYFFPDQYIPEVPKEKPAAEAPETPPAPAADPAAPLTAEQPSEEELNPEPPVA